MGIEIMQNQGCAYLNTSNLIIKCFNLLMAKLMSVPITQYQMTNGEQQRTELY